jgi:hypothetical protein
MAKYTYQGSGGWKYAEDKDPVQPGETVELTQDQVEHVTMLNRRYRVGIHLIAQEGAAKGTDKAAPEPVKK